MGGWATHACQPVAGAYARVAGIFFFSSRRRHTRSKRDWSSDVCSSDLLNVGTISPGGTQHLAGELFLSTAGIEALVVPHKTTGEVIVAVRSEERRVGKECRSWWGPGD